MTAIGNTNRPSEDSPLWDRRRCYPTEWYRFAWRLGNRQKWLFTND
jgi:hypothetical protein